ESSVDWNLASEAGHSGLQRLIADLNHLYRREPAMHQLDTEASGFEWVDANDSNQSVTSYLRKDRDGDAVLAVLNYTPVVRWGYRLGVPAGGEWRELLNTDATIYGGSGIGNFGSTRAQPVASHGRAQSLELKLPPLGALFLTK